MEEESCPIFQVGQDNFRELNQDYADQPIPITLSYNCELPNQEILAYGGFAVAWLALVIWWLIITLFVNSKNAVFLHKAITIIPVLKFLELLCQVQYWSQSCEAGELELLYSLLVYGQLYESAFFILIFALSNGIILAKQAFRGIELVLFLLVAGGSLVMELMYNEELHRFNLPVFGVLCILFLLGVVRTIYSLKSQFQAIAKYEKVQYFIIYRRKLYIYFWFVLILILFCTLQIILEFHLVDLVHPAHAILINESAHYVTIFVIYTVYRPRAYFHYYSFDLAEIPHILEAIGGKNEESVIV